MKIEDIYNEIISKIEKKEKRCKTLKSDLMVGDVVSPEKTRALIEYLELDIEELKDWAFSIEKNLEVSESRCANCGKVSSKAKGFISEYPEEGEWFCSEECKDQHDELDCPHGTHDGYRHPIESRRLIECENALRSLASWLGVGGYNAPVVDAKLFEQKIRFGVEEIQKMKTAKSWQGQVDRQGGAFDESELRGRDGWT
jgi:hypothetical protein